MFVLWVNLHGGFLIGLATLFSWTVIECWQSDKNKSQTASPLLYILIVALCLAATVVNPYGIALPLFTIQAAAMPRPYISEWQPIVLASELGALWAGLLILSIITLVRSKQSKDLPSIVVWLIFRHCSPRY